MLQCQQYAACCLTHTAAPALYCAATVRLVAVPYKLHWSSVLLADNLGGWGLRAFDPCCATLLDRAEYFGYEHSPPH